MPAASCARSAIGFTSCTTSLGRSAATLSGGEGQRIRLATQIGSNLTGVLYILDEPSIGLHQRDNRALLSTLARLRDQRMRQALVDGIKTLPEREQYVMSMYYEHDMNLKEIAAVLKVTESRVCQLHSQSIARLRVKLREW